MTSQLRSNPGPTMTVGAVVCTHLPERMGMVRAAVESLLQQTVPLQSIIVVVDSDDNLLDRVAKEFPEQRVVGNGRRQGLSSARNRGVAELNTDVVLFLDDDAVADTQWVQQMTGGFDDPCVYGTCGRSVPVWDGGKRPAWLPEEFLWAVGCTHAGTPGESTTMRNVMGGCAALRREPFVQAGGYDPELGYSARNRGGGEEADLCLRLSRANPGCRFTFQPAAIINHYVPASRQRLDYFVRRCFAEGRAKQRVSRRNSSMALDPEREFAKALPAMAINLLHRGIHGEPDCLSAALGLALGAAATLFGMGCEVVFTTATGVKSVAAHSRRRVITSGGAS